ncbi:hypothetical protein BDA99DRAFT_519891 [Phascolomyces articulosus]|uniref:Uncharacterized protein n=1 Tax=Phascolomyces articulosus TaxID=60185 RepID=A0AAD5JTA3_9FUNG|nr:hypothetical protein BDA99DRAFT_519891 [Phascolomyces articulosus]
MDYDNYDLLPEYSFTVKKRRPVEPSTKTIPLPPETAIKTTDNTLPETTLIPPDNHHQEPFEQDDPESTALFLQVLFCVFAVYFIMALARRRWYQRRMPAADPEALLKEG